MLNPPSVGFVLVKSHVLLLEIPKTGFGKRPEKRKKTAHQAVDTCSETVFCRGSSTWNRGAHWTRHMRMTHRLHMGKQQKWGVEQLNQSGLGDLGRGI